jgi:hypothetical protein
MAWKNPTPAELAADWIASQKEGADEDTTGHLAQFLFWGFPEEEPELTWEAITLVMQAYPEADFFAEDETEAQKVCGVLAAGPVEDLLSFHGHRFIQRFEEEARRDRRMAWLLGGAWQFQMTDEIWDRVRLAADASYWTRPVS